MSNGVCKILLMTVAILSLIFLAPGTVLGQGSYRTPLENHRILLIGDSQTAGNFGEAFGYEVTAYGVGYFARSGRVGWGVRRYLANSHVIRRLIREHRPTLLLVELGGNDFARSEREEYAEEVQRFWNQLNDQMARLHEETEVNWRIIWISPATAVGPSAHIQPGRDRVAEIILSVVTDRNYIESRDITSDFGRTPDGLHFTPSGGLDWVRRLMPRLESCLER